MSDGLDHCHRWLPGFIVEFGLAVCSCGAVTLIAENGSPQGWREPKDAEQGHVTTHLERVRQAQAR